MDTFFDIIGAVSHRGLFLAINGIWIGTLAAGLLWAFWRRSTLTNAATRYAVWWSMLAIVIILPFLMGSSVLKLDLEPVTSAATVEIAEDGKEDKTVGSAVTASRTKPLLREAPVRVSHEKLRTETGESARLRQPSAKPAQVEKTLITNASGRSLGSLLMGLLPVIMFAVWATVALFFTIRLYQAYRRFVGIKRNALDLHPRIVEAVRRRVDLAVSGHPIRLAASDDIDYPVAAGLGRPAILIPTSLLDQVGEEELYAIVLHELSHIQRRDDWSQLLQKFIQAIMFFHPAVHIVSRQLDLERELACDDRVMSQTGRPSEYYHCLTKLVQVTTGQGTSLVPGALSGRKQIFKRLERLLSRKKAAGSNLSPRRFASAIVSLCIGLLFLLQVAPVVALPAEPVTLDEISETLSEFVEPDRTPVEPSIKFEPPVVFEEPFEPEIDEHHPQPTEAIASMPQAFEAPEADPEPPVPPMDLDPVEAPEPPAVPSGDTDPAPPAPSAPPAVDVNPLAWDDKPIHGGGPLSDAFEWMEEFFTGSESTTITTDDDGTTVTWIKGSDRISVEVNGRVEFADDDRSVVSIEPGGYFALEEKHRGRRSEIDIESNRQGELEYTYFVNRRQQPYDDDAREWFAEVLPMVIRATGFGAEARVERILERDGVDGVLAEIDKLNRDWVIRKYTQALLESEDLEPGQVKRILNSTLRYMDSDYDMAEMLIAIADRAPDDQELLKAYVSAAKAIDSDYETRRVISQLDVDEHMSPEVIDAIFELARYLDSDYEKAELLINMAPATRSNDELHQAFVIAAEDIDSDYELRRVISSLSGRRELSDDALAELLELAEALDSDYEKAELLIELTDQAERDTDLRMKLLRTATTLDSDYEIRRVLSTQRYDCVDDREFVLGTMELLNQLDSDYERAEGLTEMAECAALDEGIRRQYFRTIEFFDSDYESKRAIMAYMKESRLREDDEVLDVLSAVENLDSDYEKSEILTKLARRCRGNKVLENAFLDIVDAMDSDYESSELYRKLYRRDRDRDDG